jgi:hypothetical protein
MKRDMNLIRLQLLRVESGQPMPELEEKYSKEEQVYHMALCIEAGLVHGQIVKNHMGLPADFSALRLTWHGHEFIDAARSDTIWNKAEERIKKSGVEVTISVLQDLLKELLKQSPSLS